MANQIQSIRDSVLQLEIMMPAKELMGLGDEYWVGEINDAMDDDQSITEFAHIRAKFHIEQKNRYVKQLEAIFEQIRQKKRPIPGPNTKKKEINIRTKYGKRRDQYQDQMLQVNVAIDEATKIEESSIMIIEHVSICNVENHKSTEVYDLLTECSAFKRFIDILKKWKDKDA
eukprot:302627_1